MCKQHGVAAVHVTRAGAACPVPCRRGRPGPCHHGPPARSTATVSASPACASAGGHRYRAPCAARCLRRRACRNRPAATEAKWTARRCSARHAGSRKRSSVASARCGGRTGASAARAGRHLAPARWASGCGRSRMPRYRCCRCSRWWTSRRRRRGRACGRRRAGCCQDARASPVAAGRARARPGSLSGNAGRRPRGQPAARTRRFR